MPDSQAYVRVGDQSIEEIAETLIDPLDYLLLEKLPEEGTLAMGYYPLGESARSLKGSFNGVPPTAIDSRLRSLKIAGLAAGVRLMPKAQGYQITKRGQEVLAAWRSRQ